MPHPTLSLCAHGPGWGGDGGAGSAHQCDKDEAGRRPGIRGNTEEGLPTQPGVRWGEEGEGKVFLEERRTK